MSTPLIPTCESEVWITYKIPGTVEYLNSAGERWRIFGTCNQCGECWKGAASMPPDLDCPIRPELTIDTPECVLTGEYL